jgi:hypothetical protein
MEKKMKRFIVSVLCASVFFIGLGNLVENVGARFKSDERALEILRQARQAIGGDQSIVAVKSLTITGRATKTFDFGETQKSEQGDWEVNLQLPDKFSKKMMIRKEAGDGKVETTDKNVVIVRQNSELKEKIMLPPNEEGGDKKKATFTIRTDGGEKTIVDGNGDKVQDRRVILYKDDKALRAGGEFQHNEMFRTTLALLLTPPQGVEVSYKYAGEGNVDGAGCDIVEALANGSTIRLFINKDSHLPAMISYQAPKMFIIRFKKDESGKANTTEDVKALREKMPAPEMTEYQVKFSDYRTVGGVQLPFRWTQTVGGKDDETIEVASYELNPANIAEKFKEEPTRVFVRTPKQQ